MLGAHLIFRSLEILVPPDVWDGGKRLGKRLAPGTERNRLQQSSMFGFRAPAMPRCPLLERIDDTRTEICDDKLGHDSNSLII